MINNFSIYKHLIWDWNGTLLDDVGECLAVLNGMLKKRDLPRLTREQYRDAFGFPVIDYYQQLGFDFEAETFDAVAQEYHAGYERQLLTCQLQSGAERVLQTAGRAGFTQSLLSAYHQEGLDKAVDHFNLRRWFIKVVGLNDYYAHSKLENGKRWVAQMDYDPPQVLFIGDTLHDYEVAQALGVDCILLTCGHQARQRLLTCPVKLFDSLNKFKKFLAPSNTFSSPGAP